MADPTARTDDAAHTRALDEHRRAFQARFGGREPRLFFSPGRVNLMGAHLDYNGGAVMPAAVDRGTFIACGQRGDRRLRMASTMEEEVGTFDLDDLPAARTGSWLDYPLGVVRHLLGRGAGGGAGLDLLFGGNLPVGAGLSSSASICVGTAYALDALWELEGGVSASIEAALWGEREFVGVHCGIMDPYAVALSRPGHLLWLDCKDALVEHVALDAERFTIAVADTGLRRSLAQGAFNERVAECEGAFRLLAPHVRGASCLAEVPSAALDRHLHLLPANLARRARHVVSEVERTHQARRALEAGDLAGFGARMSAAHESLRTLFEVSVPALDRLIDAARRWEGVYGGRLTGAGFGGCVVITLHRDAREGFAEHLARDFERAFGRRPAVEFFAASGGPRELEG